MVYNTSEIAGQYIETDHYRCQFLIYTIGKPFHSEKERSRVICNRVMFPTSGNDSKDIAISHIIFAHYSVESVCITSFDTAFIIDKKINEGACTDSVGEWTCCITINTCTLFVRKF